MKENTDLLEVSSNLLLLCIEIWKDYRNGAADYETLNVEKYSRQFSVSKFPKNLIAPILLKRAEPTLKDANDLRIEINRYRNLKRNPGKEEVTQNVMEIQTAIAILKQKGYRVMKKTIAYIDL